MPVDKRNPTGDYFKNRDYLIVQEHAMFQACQQGHGLFLNVGCGMRLLDNFVNIDKYTVHPRIRNEDISDIHMDSGTVDLIFSAHSLEHVRHRLTRRILRNWSGLLKPGGELWLSMPDLYLICQQLLTVTDPKERYWLRCTLFGFQAPGDAQPDSETDDPGQYHVAGYSHAEMEQMLVQAGIDIQWSYIYCGYGTPSFFILGVKKHGN